MVQIRCGIIVGYTTISLNKGDVYIGACQFDDVSGKTVYNINDLVKCAQGSQSYDPVGDKTIPGWHLKAPYIAVRNSNGGYNTYYYACDLWDDATQSEYAGWADTAGSAVTHVTVNPGTAFWLQASLEDDVDVTEFSLAGQVVSGATGSKTSWAGYNLLSNVFPINFDVVDNEKVETWGFEGSQSYDPVGDKTIPGWYQNAPAIMVRTAAGGYNTFYYAKDLWDDATESEYPGWADTAGSPIASSFITKVAPAGGFWIHYEGGEYTMTFKR